MFLDKILCISESWLNISEKNIEDLEVMDRMLMNIPWVPIQRFRLNSYIWKQGKFQQGE